MAKADNTKISPASIKSDLAPMIRRSLPDRRAQKQEKTPDPFNSLQSDEDLRQILKFSGEDNLMIGSDYTHNDQSMEQDFPRLLQARRPPRNRGFSVKMLNPTTYGVQPLSH